MRRERRGAEPAHQQGRRGEHAVFEQHGGRDRRADREQAAEQRPVRHPEAAEHAVLLERPARIADPDTGHAHAEIDDGGRKSRAEHLQPRQAEFTVDQRIGEHAVRRDRRKRDPQCRFGPVHRLHEAAQRDEPPRRHHAPGEAPEIIGRERRLDRGLAEREQHPFALELRHAQGNAEQRRGPEPDAERAPHHARLPRAERLRGKRRHRGHEPHADDEGCEQHGVRQRRRRHDLVAEPAEEGEVAGHHRDLAELSERNRQRELDRLDQLIAPDRSARGGRRHAREDLSRHCHGRNVRFHACASTRSAMQ